MAFIQPKYCYIHKSDQWANFLSSNMESKQHITVKSNHLRDFLLSLKTKKSFRYTVKTVKMWNLPGMKSHHKQKIFMLSMKTIAMKLFLYSCNSVLKNCTVLWNPFEEYQITKMLPVSRTNYYFFIFFEYFFRAKKLASPKIWIYFFKYCLFAFFPPQD